MKRILIYLVAIAFLCGVSSSASQQMMTSLHANNKAVSANSVVKKTETKQTETVEAADQAKTDVPSEKDSESEKSTASPESSPNNAKNEAPKASADVQKKASDATVNKTALPSTPPQSSKAEESSKIAAPTSADEAENENVVYMSITGVDDQVNIMDKQKVSFNDGDSVFDVLLRETKARKIQMEFSGLSSAAYIKGIDNLYEFDKGEGSGWLYSVNGKFPKESCSSYKLKKGDSISWKYTKDSGKDIGAN